VLTFSELSTEIEISAPSSCKERWIVIENVDEEIGFQTIMIIILVEIFAVLPNGRLMDSIMSHETTNASSN